MEIRNRIEDITILRCHACQDFLTMILLDNWRKELYSIVSYNVEGNHNRDKYIDAYNKMRDIGISNYSVDDMDISFIHTIVFYCDSIIQPVKDKTKSFLRQLINDRNLKDHSGEHETPEHLYERSYYALCNLKKFVTIVDQYETNIKDYIRQNYRQKYNTEIEELLDLIDDERISSVQLQREIEKDINIIKNSKDPLGTWVKISKLYLDRFSKEQKDKYYSFIVSASDAGIEYAHLEAMEYFFTIVMDYDEAERRMTQLYNSYEKLPIYEAKSIVDSIYYYLSHGNKITPGMKEIVEGIKSQGYDIQETDNGVYYWPRSKKRGTQS